MLAELSAAAFHGLHFQWAGAGLPLTPKLMLQRDSFQGPNRPWPCLQYEELVEAGSVTTYDNTTIYFSYNEYEEVLGEWQDKTQAKAYVDYAVYPYGKVSRCHPVGCPARKGCS